MLPLQQVVEVPIAIGDIVGPAVAAPSVVVALVVAAPLVAVMQVMHHSFLRRKLPRR